mmetsp:Transcript_125438/g.297888  ORF Transcript_125438/g.297888 Transcript_125438/m.297888 type:complete len:210 (+) Transcript_125438:757-1386(+)
MDPVAGHLKRRRGLTAALAIPRADVAGPSRFIVQDLLHFCLPVNASFEGVVHSFDDIVFEPEVSGATSGGSRGIHKKLRQDGPIDGFHWETALKLSREEAEVLKPAPPPCDFQLFRYVLAKEIHCPLGPGIGEVEGSTEAPDFLRCPLPQKLGVGVRNDAKHSSDLDPLRSRNCDGGVRLQKPAAGRASLLLLEPPLYGEDEISARCPG